MAKKKDDDGLPEIARTVEVTAGSMKGHVHRYVAHPTFHGETYYVCVAGEGCTHAYTE